MAEDTVARAAAGKAQASGISSGREAATYATVGDLLDNVFFDTCVYHQRGIDLLVDVVPHDNILFASEMVGAVRGIDPDTGNHYDDTKIYVDNAPISAEARTRIFDANIRRVFPRLDC